MELKEMRLMLMLLLVVTGEFLVYFDNISPNSDYENLKLSTFKEKKVLFVVHVINPEVHMKEIEMLLSAAIDNMGIIHVKFPGFAVREILDKAELEDFYFYKPSLLNNTLTALTNLFETTERKTKVYIISDHNLEVEPNPDYVINMILMKQILVEILMLDTDNDSSKFEESRTRRQATSSCGTNIYQCIAQQSGGTVITTNKNSISSVANLLKQSLKPQTVTIKRFTYNKPMMSKFKFPVDDTLAEISVLIRAVNKTVPPVALAYLPTGLPAAKHVQNLGQNMLLLESNITQASQYGLWQIQKLDMNTWDVTVTAQSPVDFTYQFLEPGPGGYGQYPIRGRPIAGRTVKLMVTVPQYEKMTGVSTSFFEDEFYNVFDVLNMKNVGGRRGKSMFYTTMTVPTKMFRIAIQGVDKSGHKFRRLQLAYIIPVSFKLFVPSLTGVKLYTNETLRIPFTVENTGIKKQDVDVEISDDKSFALVPLRVPVTIDPGKNFTGNFTILGGIVVGETTTLTITAKPYVRGHITNGQFEIRRLTVEQRRKVQSDPYPPTCTVTKVNGKCDIGSELCECINKRWSMEVDVSDVGYGLRDVFPTSVGSTHKFTVTQFSTPGYNTSNVTVRATLEDDCCHQTASIIATDKSGNTSSCFPNITANFKPPDFSICNMTTPLNVTITTKSIKTIGSCNQIFPCDCHNRTWRLQVEFDQTNGNNLYQAFTIGAGRNSTLTYLNSQTIEIETDCCHRDVVVSATDVAGNIGQVNVTIANFTDCTVTTISPSTSLAVQRTPVTSSSLSSSPNPSATTTDSLKTSAPVTYTKISSASSTNRPITLSTATSPPVSSTSVTNASVTPTLASNVIAVNQGLPAKPLPCFNGSIIDLQIKIQMAVLSKGNNP